MEIILLERVENLGDLGQRVTVKDGYARNYLLPQGKALRATKANLERFESEREALLARNAARREDAQSQFAFLQGQSFVILRQAGESGHLYGSVSARDIAVAIREAGPPVSPGQVVLEAPIKSVGLHEVRVALHPEVDCRVTVNVARTQDEAELQAKPEIGADDEAAGESDDDRAGDGDEAVADETSPEEVADHT